MSDDSTIRQIFHGPVANVAGRDVVQNNFTSVNVLQVLEQAVQESGAIPEEQKPGLLEQIRNLANNPYLSGLATNVIYDGLKSFIQPS